MKVLFKRPDGTLVIEHNGLPYHVLHDDPLWPVAAAAAVAMGDALGFEPGPPPKTAQELLAEYTNAIESLVDTVARQRGYRDATSCASYVGSTVPGWSDEAGAFILWRDAVWQQVLGLFAQVQAGKAEIPALEELIADLPTIAWPT